MRKYDDLALDFTSEIRRSPASGGNYPYQLIANYWSGKYLLGRSSCFQAVSCGQIETEKFNFAAETIIKLFGLPKYKAGNQESAFRFDICLGEKKATEQ